MTAKPTDSEVCPATPLPPDIVPVAPAIPRSTCERVQRSLEDYVDGVLSELDRAGVEFHLSLCPTCKAVADDYLEVVRLARALPPAAPPPKVAARLRRFIGRAIGQPDTGNE